MDPQLQKLVGAPFLRGGRDTQGIDCLGVVLAGIRILRPDLEIRDPWPDIREAWWAGRAWPGDAISDDWIDLPPESNLREGDVVFLRDPQGPNHLGIVLGPGHQILHANERVGAILTRSRRLRRRIFRIMRPPPPAAWRES